MTDSHTDAPEYLVLAGRRRWAEIARLDSEKSAIEIYPIWRVAYGALVRGFPWLVVALLFAGAAYVAWTGFIELSLPETERYTVQEGGFEYSYPVRRRDHAQVSWWFYPATLAALYIAIFAFPTIKAVLRIGNTKVILHRDDRGALASRLRGLLSDLDHGYSKQIHRELLQVAGSFISERKAAQAKAEEAQRREALESEAHRRQNDWI